MMAEQIEFTDGMPQRISARKPEQWAAAMAHELREPLNALLLSLEELTPICSSDESASLARELAHRSASHMSRVIEDFMAQSRGRRVRGRIANYRADVAESLSAAIRNVHLLLSSKGHSLEMSLPAEPVILDINPTHLEQIWTNLLSNAAKYTAAGGRIWITVEQTGSVVTLRVQDNGIGMEPEELTRVFEMYWQACDDEAQSGGLGIGLALVKSLVQLHGGEIGVTSEGLGCGTEFIVRFRPQNDVTDLAG